MKELLIVNTFDVNHETFLRVERIVTSSERHRRVLAVDRWTLNKKAGLVDKEPNFPVQILGALGLRNPSLQKGLDFLRMYIADNVNGQSWRGKLFLELSFRHLGRCIHAVFAVSSAASVLWQIL
jgi:hypothetical protein